MKHPALPYLTALTASLALAGCVNLAPTYTTPVAPIPATVGADAPADPVQATAPALEQAQSLTWVQTPALQQVLALALSHNRDLKIAWANIEKARAQYGVQRADLLPTITASGQGSRNRTSADLTTSGRAATTSQFSAQIGFTSYELDLWGRVRNLNEVALEQFWQTAVNQRSVEITLLADVANAWLTLAADQARLQLAQDTLTSRRKAFELTQRIHALGATSGLVLAQNQTTVDSARADVASFASQVERDRNALQLLVGGPLPAALLPQALDGTLPPTAALLDLPTPLPSSLLLVRPDIVAAEHSLRGATANIGAARAALFPSISLTASAGSASSALSGLFEGGNGTWSFLPQVRLPIFDGGRNQANVRVAEANQQLALAQYEKTVQIAFREVADALAERAHWAERLDAQSSLVEATQKALMLSEARFKSGVDNYLSVLDAQRSLYAAQQTQISLYLAEQANRITLYKVLGGG
ncbi:efflux transporter outer membrane subunit [Simplicispira psychrophila]|uniref:efflux transporter outer membrane subunit n=1 Tax=Simplicispira psychrophila TaxID=80882 RepID=UPI0006894614|nr:efflux transporter outer membrane subunit [Simplicispira psychrophila]